MRIPDSPTKSPRQLRSERDRTKTHLSTVMLDILDDHEGGEGSEALRKTRNQEPDRFSRVNAYWGYTLFGFRGRPFPGVPLLAYLIYCSIVVSFGLYYMKPNGELDKLKSMKPELKDVTQLFGLAVFLVLAFRNNSAYARW